LQIDQPVIVRSSAGEMKGILVRAFDIRSGNALMYYPEANVLVPTTTDALSRTPAFKCVLITVEGETHPESLERHPQEHTTGRTSLSVISDRAPGGSSTVGR
jgi:hypothetical protein